jgi:hypothetical protein
MQKEKALVFVFFAFVSAVVITLTVFLMLMGPDVGEGASDTPGAGFFYIFFAAIGCLAGTLGAFPATWLIWLLIRKLSAYISTRQQG